MGTTISTIKITKTTNSRINEVDFENIPFGKVFSDHMFSMDYANGEWKNFEIIPFQNLNFSPAMSSLHYGQSIFEGMKAYRKEDKIYTFRAKDNFERLNKSANRMCMPNIPNALVMDALEQLLKLDEKWIPDNDSNSLYLRPFMFATDEYVGIRPSETYKFIIFGCPVGSYYTEPLKVKIESHYTRAANGGVGEAKAAGNYAASLYPAKLAKADGYHQLLWTDSKEHKYIEESGTMNVMFVINGKLITPDLSGTILPGITRRSVLEIVRSWGIEVEERKIEVSEIIDAMENGTLQEAFGAGTAATIAQIQTIGYEGKDYTLPTISERKISNKVLNFLTRLKRGQEEDKWGWIKTF
jgi:branched-chain amino acid aminotransferase